ERAAGEERATHLVPERAAGEERAAQHDEGPPSLPARFDLVHSHHWMSGVAAIPLAREAGIPHVMTYHSVAAHPNSPLRDGEPPESPARLDGEVYCARESDLILAVSHHEAAVVIGRCQADPEKVAIVQPGVDIELFHPAEPGSTWTPAPDVAPGYLLFAARLQPLKAPDVAIRTLALLPAAERPDLVIVGQVSEDFAAYEAELHQLVADMGLQDKITFLPGQDRESFAHIMRHASVLLVPSHSETFGLVALEASASGVPVLAAAAGGLTEAICNTHTGLLVPTHNPHAWAGDLLALLRDPEYRARLGRTGRQRSESMTWAHSAQHTVDNYRRVLAQHCLQRVAFVHAHPDDETLASGAFIAHLADSGVDVSLLTATRGEMGQVVPGPLSALAGTPELERRREAELAGAVDSLGITHHAYLGMPPARATGLEPRRYLDSGMQWISDGVAGPADTSDERSLYAADAEEAVADIAAFLRRTRAEFAVSYDDDGGYGHPDHVRLHHLTRAAAEVVGIPYASLTADQAKADRWVELERYRPRVAEALRHHRTQLTVHDEHNITHSGGQADTIITSIGLRGAIPRLP
ncbi:MAG: glycosyltransferase, partial [Propionibacteriaceae bacterium]|nr:glycosyltransferase [Propionibacteriaceae bacterium]